MMDSFAWRGLDNRKAALAVGRQRRRSCLAARSGSGGVPERNYRSSIVIVGNILEIILLQDELDLIQGMMAGGNGGKGAAGGDKAIGAAGFGLLRSGSLSMSL